MACKRRLEQLRTSPTRQHAWQDAIVQLQGELKRRPPSLKHNTELTKQVLNEEKITLLGPLGWCLASSLSRVLPRRMRDSR